MDMSKDQDHCSWPLFNLHAKGVEVGRSNVDRESSKDFRSVLKT